MDFKKFLNGVAIFCMCAAMPLAVASCSKDDDEKKLEKELEEAEKELEEANKELEEAEKELEEQQQSDIASSIVGEYKGELALTAGTTSAKYGNTATITRIDSNTVSVKLDSVAYQTFSVKDFVVSPVKVKKDDKGYAFEPTKFSVKSELFDFTGELTEGIIVDGKLQFKGNAQPVGMPFAFNIEFK